MSLTRRLSLGLLALALVGCTGTPQPTPTTSTADPTAAREAACLAAIATVVKAVTAQVARYEPAPASPLPSPSAPVTTASPSVPAASSTIPTTSATVPPTSPDADPNGGSHLDAALQAARKAAEDNRCDPTAFSRKVATDLGALRPQGPLATAVLARLTASITGQVPERPVDRSVRVAEDLLAVIASAPAGSTLRLEQGDHRLAQTIVLLDGISLVGEGNGKSRLLSSAPDAAILNVTPATVTISHLSIVRDPDIPGSGIVTGPEAALVLDHVRISGGRLSKSKSGGAAVHLSGAATDQPRGTTLQVDNSTFSDNAWAGIVVTGRHRTSIQSSVFADNRECGVCFLDKADGSISDSRFARNRVGVAALGASSPTLVDNRLSGGQVGIQADGNATPALRDNAVTGASKAAVIYGGTATGTIAGTTCPGAKYGIVVGSKAAPTLLKNPCPVVGGV